MSMELSRNSEEAQNQSAKLAFVHFTSMAHLYKNQLQIYAQKSNLALPAYTLEHEVPPHASRFKSKVTLGGKIYESPEYFNTVKEAENAAAKVALLAVSPGDIEKDEIGFSKNLLQEFLQREYSCLPKYTTSQAGASHVPRFVSMVDINGEAFKGDEAKTKKQAEANAAKVAYIAFKDQSSGGTTALSPASSIIVQPRIPDSSHNASFGQTTFMTKDDERFKGMAHLYKNQLQIYAQKSNLALPAYTLEHEVPPHASRFKSKVTLGGKIYESPEYFNTVKEAENAAAKVALLAVSPGDIEKDEIGFSKNLLQEFLRREYSCLPKYTTSQAGASHVPRFVSTVDINGETFKGDEANTKKQAEANAAKVAYIAFKDPVTEEAKSLHVMKTTEVEEKDTTSSSLQNPLQADSQSEKVDSSAVAASEEVQVLIVSVEEVSHNKPTASVPPRQRPSRKMVSRPFKPGMEIPPEAILQFCDEKYIAYEVPNDD